MEVFMYIVIGELDAHMRLVLDEIFGKKNFRNEIIWHYTYEEKDQIKDFKKKQIYF